MPEEWTSLEPISDVAYILASGFSLDHYPDDSLEKLMDLGTVIGVNDVSLDFPCHYNIRKSIMGVRELQEKGLEEGNLPEELPKYEFANEECVLVVSEYDLGSKERELNTEFDGEYYFFRHNHNNSLWKIEFPEPSSDDIMVSWTTTSSAMHFAAKMGAKQIILIGHDLKSDSYSKYSIRGPRYLTGYWGFRGQAIQVQNFIHENYDATVCTLTPFMGIGNSDNKWPKYKDVIVKTLVVLPILPRIILNRIGLFFRRGR